MSLLPFFLVATLFAGCLGGAGPAEEIAPQDEPQSDPAGRPTPSVQEENRSAATPQVPFRFPLDRPVDVVHWMNGSFAPQDTGAGGGFVTGAFVKAIDLSEHLPEEVPVRVEMAVTLDADELPVIGPTARADPISNGTVWYEGGWRQTAPGTYALDAVLKRGAGDTFGIALEAYTPGPAEPPEVAYTMRLHVVAHPEGIPVGVPVAASLGANATVRFATEGPDPAELLIHGPDDRLVDRLYFAGATEWTVPTGMSGEFVILPIRSAQGIRLSADAPDDDVSQALRPLGLVREIGAPHEVATLETTTWTFDLDKRPLRILVGVEGPSGGPWVCSGSLDVRLDAPEGTVLERTADCPSPTNVPFLYGEEHVWASDLGDSRLVTGTYEVTVENTLWYGHHAFHTVETYTR